MKLRTTNEGKAKFDPPVFYTSTAILLLLVAYAVIFPEGATARFQKLQDAIIANLSWYYVLIVAILLVTVVAISVSRFGNIKLGQEHEKPAYSYGAWLAMLFSAGIGIGLLFFGVAEPVMHYLTPPDAEPGTAEAARSAMVLSIFHWGLHVWAIFAGVALILGYFSYRHNLPLTLRSALYPLIGERIHGPIGNAVDVFAIVSTICGVATTLGFGVLQMNAGLNHLFGIPVGKGVQVILIAGTTALATISVVVGLDAGIKRLSQLNMGLAAILALTVLIFGSTVFLFQTFVENIGNYLSVLINRTFNLYAYAPTDWLGGWTIFYWGWGMSWSPFVGLFIARISRGRTIRQFTIGALLMPTLITIIWFTIFGDSAIHMIRDQGLQSLGDTIEKDLSLALFQFLEQFPFSEALSLLAIVLVVVFFVTSADSGALVMNMLSSHGRDDTPVWQRIFWAATIGTVAIALLLAGGLASLQTAALTSALPFSAILIAALYGLVKALHADSGKQDTHSAPVAPISARIPFSWKQRLDNLVQLPSLREVHNYIRETARPALQDFAAQMEEKGFETKVTEEENAVVRLEIFQDGKVDFLYSIRPKAHLVSDASDPDAQLDDSYDDGSPDKYFRPEVHLSEGGLDYDVMGWTRDQLLMDILSRYGRHLQFQHALR